MPRSFARLCLAADGEQVLFIVDEAPTGDGWRVRAISPMPNNMLFAHSIIFDRKDMAYQCLEAFDEEQIELTRKMALDAGMRQPTSALPGNEWIQ